MHAAFRPAFSTDDAEHLLTAPEFSAGVAMAMLHLSGVDGSHLGRLDSSSQPALGPAGWLVRSSGLSSMRISGSH